MNTGFPNAPKRTRTSTGKSPHKALNLGYRVFGSFYLSQFGCFRTASWRYGTPRTAGAGWNVSRLVSPGCLPIVPVTARCARRGERSVPELGLWRHASRSSRLRTIEVPWSAGLRRRRRRFVFRVNTLATYRSVRRQRIACRLRGTVEISARTRSTLVSAARAKPVNSVAGTRRASATAATTAQMMPTTNAMKTPISTKIGSHLITATSTETGLVPPAPPESASPPSSQTSRSSIRQWAQARARLRPAAGKSLNGVLDERRPQPRAPPGSSGDKTTPAAARLRARESRGRPERRAIASRPSRTRRAFPCWSSCPSGRRAPRRSADRART